jgi:type IV pilus assembly protein PilX
MEASVMTRNRTIPNVALLRAQGMTLPTRQRGVVLFIALIVLVAMTIAGIALVRSVDTANQISGNLAFRQGATHGGDAAVEAARTWILAQTGNALFNDVPVSGYYAFKDSIASWSKYDWSTKAPSEAVDANTGNRSTYVIHRLCATAGDPNSPGVSCLSNLDTSGTNPGNSKQAEKVSLTGTTALYYRVTARVVGPRNTVSFVQAVILN